jgi:curved DNA-binding protein CbpA
MTDYFEVLGVSRQASAAEVRQAYLRLAKEKHPDRFPDPVEKEKAQEFFKELTAAFNTLSNERSRREYEAETSRPKLTSPEEIAQDAYARGVQQLEQRQYHEAVELLRSAVHHAPTDARYHAVLGKALGKNPQWTREAIQSVEKAIQLDQRQAAFHVLLAELYLRQGLKLRARRAIESAQRLAPADPSVQRMADLVDQGD